MSGLLAVMSMACVLKIKSPEKVTKRLSAKFRQAVDRCRSDSFRAGRSARLWISAAQYRPGAAAVLMIALALVFRAVAADGSAGRGISVRHFRRLDRHRPCDRHLSQLAARSQAAAPVHQDRRTTPSRCRSSFKNRFHDESGWISVISALFILVFFLFYTASGFVSCAKLFSSVFGIPYLVSLAVGAVVVISYTFAGGFFAVCWTDFFQGMLMFFCVVAVPLIAIFRMGGPAEFISSVEAFNPNFLSMMVDGATNTPYTAMGIVSLVAWGLGYFGQPHILVRFMGISSPAAIKKSRRIATVWVVISLTAAVMIGVSGRMVLGDGLLDGNGQQEIIYITMVSKFFPLFIAGIFLSAILAAIMSTADSPAARYRVCTDQGLFITTRSVRRQPRRS